MDTICAYLKLDHQRCDDLFYRVETGVAQRNWEEAMRHFREYEAMMRRHIRMEENILLPAFLQTLTDSSGPISMLRMEHVQIQALIERMRDAIRRANPIDYVLHAETLTLLMQGHTMKEEDMLYPLLDRAMGSNRSGIISAMGEYRQPEPAPRLAVG